MLRTCLLLKCHISTSQIHIKLADLVSITKHCPAALGSTSNFDFPPEELDKFTKDHNLNGGSAGASADEDEDDYPENLVYVSSPKVEPMRAGSSYYCQKHHMLHGQCAEMCSSHTAVQATWQVLTILAAAKCHQTLQRADLMCCKPMETCQTVNCRLAF